MFDIEEELKKIPSKPGVYLMHGEDDSVIYVGKAKLLNRRVRQYFRPSSNHSEKIKHMVSHVSRFEYIVTDSELEALVLESNLIKEHRPKYNTMLMDDKSYPYIKVTVKEDFPRVIFSRDKKHDSNKYFGPYTSAYAVKETIDLLCKLYKIRTCKRRLPQDIGKKRPCLNYHIDKCSAPCDGKIDKQQYRESVEEVIEFLKGNFDPVIENLTAQMKKSAAELDFEEAARLRDLRESVLHVSQKQKISGENSDDRDVIAYERSGDKCIVSIFFIRDGKMLGRDYFHIAVAEGDGGGEITAQFMKQYYGGTPYIPDYFSVMEIPDDEEAITDWLSEMKGKKVHIQKPQRGFHKKLVDLARENAKTVLEKDLNKLIREEKRTTGAMAELASLLGIAEIKRLEAYDISNTNGTESVGSMVVFEGGSPKKHDYRRFKIKTVTGPDDYASLREVLTRRFNRAIAEMSSGDEAKKTGFSKLPDVIFMDGGRGQAGIAEDVLASLGLDIAVAGMVKDDTHSTRGIYFKGKELPIDEHSEGFKLLTRIQDEAHRFAIDYHRKLRADKQVHSLLDEIKGIGPERRRALMRHFGDIKKIREAGVEELAKVDKMNTKAANAVYDFFHREIK